MQVNRRGIGIAAALVLSVCLWMVGGCTESHKARPGTIARMERKISERPAVLSLASEPGEARRSLADAGPPRCLKDRLEAAVWLRSDVRDLEGAAAGDPVKQTWNGIQLSQFPAPQGRFLTRFSSWIADGDYSACAADPAQCVVNQAYGTPDGDAGWQLYGWYLKTGYGIAVQDYLPPHDSFEGTTLKDYLFKPEEARAFWKLSWLLPPIYHAMGSLQTIHRIPSGGRPSDFGKDTCGMFFGSHDEGYIRLEDRCLELGSKQTPNWEGFYHDVTHEMSHALDAWLGNRYGPWLSETKDWLDLSGWTQETVVNPDDNRPGVRWYRWHADPKKDRFVRDYAATSPKEDWADTVALFRFDPEWVQSVAPNKAAFISKTVYGGRTFTAANIGKSYEETAFQAVDRQLLDLVHNCASGSDSLATGAAIMPANHLVFENPLPEALVSCLERGLNERISVALDQLRATEYEACDVLANGEADLRAKLFVRLNPDVTALLAKQASLEPMLNASNALHDAIQSQVDPREAYVHCFRQADPEGCYQTAVTDGFDRASQPMANALGDLLQREREAFLARNTYVQAAAAVNDFYRRLFAGIEKRIADAAKTRWSECLVGRGDRDSPAADGATLLTQPFTGGQRFVSAGILNCLNLAVAGDIKDARERFLGSLAAITDPDAQAFLGKLFEPLYVAQLKQELDAAAAAEDAAREKRRQSVVDVLVSGLLAKPDWIDSSASAADAEARCEPLALTAFDAYFAQPGLTEKLPARFAAVEDIRLAWSRDACSRAAQSPVVGQAIQANLDKAWKQGLTDLDGFVADRAGKYASNCAARYPDTARRSLQRDRRRCLINAWNAVESEAMGDWDQSPAGKQFAGRRAEAKQGLVRRRSQLQDDAVRKMETH